MFIKYLMIVGAGLSSLAFAQNTALCDSIPQTRHQGYHLERSIPWLNKPSDGVWKWNSPPKVKAWLGKDTPTGEIVGRSRELTVDKGSTGIVIAERMMDNWDPAEATTDNEGYLFLTSSKLLYVGHWVDRYIWYNRNTGTTADQVKAKVPILVISHWIKCPRYVLGDGRECKDTTDSVRNDTASTSMMGIGFGRTGDGQGDSTPDKNPLLNINMIGSTAVTTSNFWHGWIVNQAGLIAGLTKENFDDREFKDNEAQLPVVDPVPATVYHRSWHQLQGFVKAQGVPTGDGLSVDILLDTGIDYSSIRIPGDSDRPATWEPWDTTWSSHVVSGQRFLDSGVNVHVQLGVPEVADQTYTVTTGTIDDTSVTPVKVNKYHKGDDPRKEFVNTGSHIFRKLEVAFDPVCGRLAFNPTPSPTPVISSAHKELLK